LKAYFSYREQETGLYFWRTRAGNEVDFICYGKDVFTAIEVKNSKILHPKDFSGLKAFREDYPEAQLLLLYRGKDKIRKHSILCLPCESFLLHLNPKYSLREIMA
jgi:predicted AAA+ superfamily ATPase